METRGRVHSFESFGTLDGPGIRFVVFFQGCPLRCKCCHNPDTWEMNSGKEYSASELVCSALRYREYFGKDGGVTASGGEPLMQSDFLYSFFDMCHKEKINTCLDTSGVTFNESPSTIEKFNELMEVTDLVLLDIKHIKTDNHRALTGHPNENILKFARYLDKLNKPIWIRHVLVPGINTDKESLTELRKFINTLSNVKNIEILPYHTYGVDKYKNLGLEYKLKGVEPPTEEQVALANKILKG